MIGITPGVSVVNAYLRKKYAMIAIAALNKTVSENDMHPLIPLQRELHRSVYVSVQPADASHFRNAARSIPTLIILLLLYIT
jgi:hypothetical protein